MITKQTFDIDEIKEVLCNPAIYDVINDDLSPPSSEFEPPLEGCRYIGGYVGGKIIALFVYHDYRDGEWCHIQVLPEYRKEYAQLFGSLSVKYNRAIPQYAEIPTLYQNVINFAIRQGYEIIETISGGLLKNGQQYDIEILKRVK